MKEYSEGKLHSGSKKGPVVKNKDQAVAIAMSEQRKKDKGKQMDKKIKALQKDTAKLAKKEASLLREDKRHDKVIDRAKKKMKGKC